MIERKRPNAVSYIFKNKKCIFTEIKGIQSMYYYSPHRDIDKEKGQEEDYKQDGMMMEEDLRDLINEGKQKI